MQLEVVIIPPEEVIEDALTAAERIFVARGPTPEGSQPGLLTKVFGRATPPPTLEPLVLTAVPSPLSLVRLGTFGNVTVDDAQALTRSLGLAAPGWPPPALQVTGLRFELAEHHDLVVTAKLGGDIGGLSTLSRDVIALGKQQGLTPDRRAHRPELELARVEMPDDPSAWERLDLGDAEAHHGPVWQATRLSIVRTDLEDGRQAYAEVEAFALAERPEPG